MEVKELVDVIVKELDERKANNINVIDVTERTPFADYYVIATALNSRHMKALIDEVEDKIAEQGIDVSHKEGTENSDWMLIDAFGVVVNVFTEAGRTRFDLDTLLSKKNK